MTTGSGYDENWIRRFADPAADGGPDDGARADLVCFPHAGGSAPYFRPLAEALGGLRGDGAADPAGIRVLAVQYPGRLDRRAEPPIADVAALADGIFAALRPGAGNDPPALLGHSLGAVLAYEVALRFAEAGHAAPVHLFLSGRRAPTAPGGPPVPPGDDAALLAELRELDAVPPGILEDPDVLELIMPALRADFGAIAGYRDVAAKPLECPITVLHGDRDPRVSLAQAEGWSLRTAGDFRLRVFHGGHFYLADQWASFAHAVATDLGRSRPSQSARRVRRATEEV